MIRSGFRRPHGTCTDTGAGAVLIYGTAPEREPVPRLLGYRAQRIPAASGPRPYLPSCRYDISAHTPPMFYDPHTALRHSLSLIHI